MAAIVKIRDENGNIIEIPAFRGPRGLTGETGPQGPKGDPGDATINDTATSSTSVWSSQKVVDYLNENYQPEIPVDSALSNTSENPVQNKVINAALEGKSNTGHTHAAEDITSGTFAGKVQANATAAATLGNAQVRDIIISTTDLTAGSSTLATGTVYLVYE